MRPQDLLPRWDGRRTAGPQPATASPAARSSAGTATSEPPPPAPPPAPAPAPAEPGQLLLGILRARLDNPDIGLDDDFYAAGGDSLLALGVVAEAKRQGLAIGLRDLLTSPNVRELVALLPPATANTARDGGTADPGHHPGTGPDGTSRPFDGLSTADRTLLPAGIADAHPASALQVGLIYLCELAGDPGLYHDLIGLRVRAGFDEQRLRAALGQVVARHPTLRSSFDLARYSAALQLVWPEVTLPVQVEAVPGPEEQAADRLVARWRDRQLATGIGWAEAPAFRCHVVALPGSFRLTVAIHHAIIDGWSLARLLVELLTCYDAALAGRPPALPAVPASGYRDFVALERASARSAESAAFWQAEADVPPLLLPRRPLGDVADPTATRTVRLDPARLDRLRAAATGNGVPVKSLLLGIHGWALGRATGRDRDVVSGLVVNGRPEYAGADALLGLFLNTVPVRLRSVAGGWAEAARAAWDAERVLACHRRYPLSAIEQALGRPAFDVSFNFTHFHTYRDLDALANLRVDSWWAYDKASFPMMVDAMIDAPEFGTGVVVAFDPARLDGSLIDGYLDVFEAALDAAVDAAAAVGGPSAVLLAAEGA